LPTSNTRGLGFSDVSQVTAVAVAQRTRATVRVAEWVPRSSGLVARGVTVACCARSREGLDELEASIDDDADRERVHPPPSSSLLSNAFHSRR
jgi:hypothetical protein